jgi:arylsulfatase A-like enzyme
MRAGGRFLAMLCAAWTLAAGAAERPHIVYILADDLGWKDVGFHGSPIRTPALDRLAHDGVRLERFYTTGSSTQTRAALMTGRYPMRYGLQTLSIQPWNHFGLPLEERLLPQALKDAGYRTVMLGKWQLGHAKRDFWPTRRGFDAFYGSLCGGIDYFRKTGRHGEYDWFRNEQALKEDGYITTLTGREAVRVIEKHDPNTPLFLYVSFQAPQAPLQAPLEPMDRYKSVQDESRRIYAAMVSSLDDAVGTIAQAIERKGMTSNTLFVFHSDNGGAVPNKFQTGDGDVRRAVADNGPYRDGKGSYYEGALRVVAFASWAGKLAPGVVSERIHVTDMYPTLIGVAGGKPEQTRPIDGMNQWPTIAGGELSPRKEILLGMEDFRGALMIDDWKLIVSSRLPVRTELYQVQDDPSEEDNRADREPQKVQELMSRLNEYAWDMVPSLYLQEMAGPHKYEFPIFWGENPIRP